MAVNIDDFQKRYNQIDSVRPNDDGTFTVDNKRLSLAEYKKVKAQAKKRLDEEKKKASQKVETQSDVEELRKQVQIDTLILAGEDLPKDLQAYQSSGRFNPIPLAQREKRLKENRAKLQESIPVGEGEESASAGMFRIAEAVTSKGVKPKPKEKPKGKTKTDTGVSGGGTPTVPGTSVGDSTTKGGVNYIWNGTKWVAQGKVAFESIVEKFKTMFPSSAWIADIDPAKYPDVRKLLERAVTGRYADTEQGLARFKAEWESTDFFNELRTDNQVREIKSLVGDLGFDTVPFNKFLTTSMNMGWRGDTLKSEVYKEVFRRDDATDAFVNPTAVERVKKSNPYLAVAKIGKEFFSSVDDRDIQRVLTGEMLTEDVQRKQRELAKMKYGHLANLIDQDFTLEELASPFKQQAAQLLEKTVDDIDMSQAQFEAAYNYGEPGQKRMMTQGEWEIMLRSDAKYGWDKTNNAKAEARQLASSIAQAFGRVI